MSVLLESLDGGILTLTLNRPEKRNALSSELIGALDAALAAADLRADVRVVVLRGAGDDFCAGADLRELLASADRSPAENEADALRLGALFGRLRTLAQPAVAAVQGRALAGGAGLASACDIVLAAESASFGYPEIHRGFVPAMVLVMLRRLVGPRAAFDLVATGRTLTAHEAVALGIATRAIPDAAFEDEVAATTRALANASRSALHLTKRLFHELDGQGFAEGIALGARTNALARATPDFRQAIATFLQR